MAITVQTAGHVLSASGASSGSTSVTLGAGSNRRMFVCLTVEWNAGEENNGFSSVTYGGNALSQTTDGVDAAVFDTSVAHCEFYDIREASLPGDGSNTLAWTLSAGQMHDVSWVILEGCDQAANVEFTAPGAGAATTGTTLSMTEDVSGEDRCIFAAFYGNNTGLAMSATIGGSAATEHFQQDHSEGGATTALYTRILTTQTGTITSTLTCSSTNRRNGAGFAVAPATGSSLTATASFASGSSTAAATVSRVREANASFAGGDSSLSVTASRGRELTSSFSSGQAAMAVSATRARDATATFAAGAAAFSTTAEITGNKTATAAFASGAAAFSSSAAVTSNLEASASFQASSATMAASAARGRDATASFASGASTLAASASRGRTAAAAFSSSTASFSATLSSPIVIVRPGASVTAHVAEAGVSARSALSSVSAAEATSKVIVSRAT